MPKVLGTVHNSYKSQLSTVIKSGSAVAKRRISYHLAILSDDLTQDEDDIEATTGVPPLLSPVGPYIVRGYNSEEVTEVPRHPTTGIPCRLWNTEVFLDNDLDPNNPNNTDPNAPPETRRPKVSWNYETEEERAERDANGVPIRTGALEPIIVTHPVTIAILTIERYEGHPFNPNLIYDYGNHVNEQPFWGAPVGCAWLLPMQTEEEEISWGSGNNLQTALYERVKYTIKFKIRRDPEDPTKFEEHTWRHRPLSQGYYYIPDSARTDYIADPSDGNVQKLTKIYLDPETGSPKTINLNFLGFPLPAGDDPVFLEFEKFPKKDLNLLNLGPFA